MLTINGIQYSTSKIILTKVQNTKINLSSTSSVVTWEILKTPSSNNSNITIVFDTSGLTISSSNPESLSLSLSGNYRMRAIESDVNGNYIMYDIYFQATDVITNGTIPFAGQSLEMNEITGWAKTIENMLQNSIQKPSKIVKAVSVADLDINSLVCITGINEKDTTNFTYNINDVSTCTDDESSIGIIIDKKEIDENAGSLAEQYMYIVMFHGICKITNAEFEITVDANHNFYYNNEVLTIVNTDFYVGKYYDTEKILWIDNEIHYNSIRGVTDTLTVGSQTVTITNGIITNIV